MKQLNYTTRLLCVSTVKHLHTFSDCAPLLSSCRDPTVYNAEKMVNFWSNALNSNIRNFERENRSISINEHAEVESVLTMDKVIPIEGYSDAENLCQEKVATVTE